MSKEEKLKREIVILKTKTKNEKVARMEEFTIIIIINYEVKSKKKYV